MITPINKNVLLAMNWRTLLQLYMYTTSVLHLPPPMDCFVFPPSAQLLLPLSQRVKWLTMGAYSKRLDRVGRQLSIDIHPTSVIGSKSTW